MEILFVHWNINPAIFQIGGFELRWYSLLFVSGFIIGWYIVRWFFRREGISEKLLDPLLYTLLICTIVGARLGHCIFYQPDYYFGSWSGFFEIFMPWKGGLASHGGTLAIVLGMIWYSHKYGIPNGFDFWWMADRIVIPICFAAAAIRLGNLFNSEIYGDVTNLPWGFVFERRGEVEPKHPTQLYEALTYLLLGLALIWVYAKRLDKIRRGEIVGYFFIILWSMRFLIEFIKEPQVGFEETMALNMGQLLSIPFILLGVAFVIVARVRNKPAAIVRPAPAKKQPTHHAHPLN